MIPAEDRPLPAATLAALDRIAAGNARTATAAHPDCRCGKPYLPTCRACGAKPNQPCRPIHFGDLTFDPPCPTRQQHTAGPRDCPQHRPEPRRSR